MQDMTSALAIIDVSGEAALDILGVSPLARQDSGVFTTRLAGLRSTAVYRRGAEQCVQLIVDRFSADYLWAWLIAKAST